MTALPKMLERASSSVAPTIYLFEGGVMIIQPVNARFALALVSKLEVNL
ncbi:hypothetical protein O9993_03045 [Vibrio lentus]|nr:hypothetical protein [Vibrio lentus]